MDEEIDEEVDREVYWILYSQENSIRKCSRVRVSGNNEGTPSGKCEKNSEVLRAGRRAEEDSTSSSRNRGGKGIWSREDFE